MAPKRANNSPPEEEEQLGGAISPASSDGSRSEGKRGKLVIGQASSKKLKTDVSPRSGSRNKDSDLADKTVKLPKSKVCNDSSSSICIKRDEGASMDPDESAADASADLSKGKTINENLISSPQNPNPNVNDELESKEINQRIIYANLKNSMKNLTIHTELSVFKEKLEILNSLEQDWVETDSLRTSLNNIIELKKQMEELKEKQEVSNWQMEMLMISAFGIPKLD